LYGHVWVTLSWVVRHGVWGTIGLPLLARLYVRQKNLKSIAPWYKVKFQTKLQQAADLVEWTAQALYGLGKALWIVVDGGFVKRPFLERALAAGAVVVGRLRKDAALWSVPETLPPGQRKRGRPRKYGKDRIRLAKRASHRQGWQGDDFVLYREKVRKKFKTFLATYKPVGGLIRVAGSLTSARRWTRAFRKFWKRWPTGRRSSRIFTTSRKCMERANNNCGTIGPTSRPTT